MRALVTTPGANPPIELREVAEPEPAPDQAVVAVRAVSLNRGECRALASSPEGRVPGWDVAGEVVAAAADGTGPTVGTRVVGLVPAGAWAERVAVSTSLVSGLPDAVSYEAASTLPVAGLTAYHALRVAKVHEGCSVLVTGASGGVGRFAIQLACHTDAAEVTAVVGRPERGEGLAELGAAHVVVGMPSGREYQVILESVGGDHLAQALTLVAPHGSIVTYGNSSGQPTTFDVSRYYPRNGASLTGFVLFPELDRQRTAPTDLARLADHVANGRLDPSIDATADWGAAVDVVAALLERRIAGKAVLTVT